MRASKGRLPLLMLCVSIAVFLFTRTHKFLTVDGTSMVPTLNDGNVCIVESVIYPCRGDIYVLQEPDDKPLAIKRLVGIPGDFVELEDGNTYVNGEILDLGVEGTWEHMTFILGADEYLFLGDNRKDSYDGRYWSRPVHRSEILFRVTTRIFPMSTIGQVG